MDTKKEGNTAQCGEGTARRLIVGAKQIRKALDKGTVKQAFLAENADPAITDPIEELCRQHHIPCTRVPTMEALGKACGIDVGAAAAAAVDE